MIALGLIGLLIQLPVDGKQILTAQLLNTLPVAAGGRQERPTTVPPTILLASSHPNTHLTLCSGFSDRTWLWAATGQQSTSTMNLHYAVSGR